MTEEWTGVIFGMGVLILGTTILIVVLIQVGNFMRTRTEKASEDRFAGLSERYQELAEQVGAGQETAAADLADIRARVTEIERLLRDVG